MKPLGYLFKCSCGFEKRIQTKWRGIPCNNCDGIMKFSHSEARAKNSERSSTGGTPVAQTSASDTLIQNQGVST